MEGHYYYRSLWSEDPSDRFSPPGNPEDITTRCKACSSEIEVSSLTCPLCGILDRNETEEVASSPAGQLYLDWFKSLNTRK